MPHGFINDMLDVKLLILYITDKLLYPVDTQTLYELCLQDDKLSYFDVMQAVPQMVETGHLSETEGGYVITDKGREAARITRDSLAFPVQQRASRAVERFNREVRRESFVRTEVLEQPNGEALAVMHLDDELGSLVTIEYTCPSARQAAFLTKAFPGKADKLYQLITETLTAKENTDENTP
ncbi:MAG: DUF4364 family protein [Oscillospiraceae bacterium]|jgi:hypothetical protein|nr:DUF4364 family protein [Oscillospiraceae bacterium]MBR4194349.1 DUF4364 family protein [Oscillospiraceae bacterium]